MNKKRRSITVWIVICAMVIGFLWFFNLDAQPDIKEVKESTMIGYLKSGKVETLEVEETKMTAELDSGKKVYAYVHSAVDLSFIYDQYVMPQVSDGKLKLKSPAPKKAPARRTARPAASVPTQAAEEPAFPEPEEWADASAYAPDPAADEEGSFPEPAAPEAEDGAGSVSGGDQMTMDLS